MNEVAEKQERAESGRARYKTKERPPRQIRAGDPSDDGTAPRPGDGAAEREKADFFPRYYTKKAPWPQGFPGYFLFYRYEKLCLLTQGAAVVWKNGRFLWEKWGGGHKMLDFSEKYRNFVEKIEKVVDRGKIHPL